MHSRPDGSTSLATDHRPNGALFRNEILARLSSSDLEIIRPSLHRVSLASAQVLHERNSPIADVYFMEEGICSLTADTSDGGHVEVGVTGREGFVGVTAILNPEAIAVHRAFIQIPGSGFRCASAALRTTIEQSPTLRDRCSRCLQMVMLESAQAAACNARHNLPERLARWLLTVRDRVDTDTLPLTHEFLSIMLGVRRAGVTLAAQTLQAGGLIRQSRGRITILDRDGLAAASCDCYRIVRESRDQIFANRR